MPKVVVVKPGQKPEVVAISNDRAVAFEEVRKLVGGERPAHIVPRVVARDLTLFCDEDADLRNLPPNREIGGEVFLGTLVFAKFGKAGVEGLNAKGLNKAVSLTR